MAGWAATLYKADCMRVKLKNDMATCCCRSCNLIFHTLTGQAFYCICAC